MWPTAALCPAGGDRGPGSGPAPPAPPAPAAQKGRERAKNVIYNIYIYRETTIQHITYICIKREAERERVSLQYRPFRHGWVSSVANDSPWMSARNPWRRGFAVVSRANI